MSLFEGNLFKTQTKSLTRKKLQISINKSILTVLKYLYLAKKRENMSTGFFENQSFNNLDFSETGIEGKEFERCTFKQCNFSGCDLSNLTFSECLLENCDISMANLNNTSLQEIHFSNCKMLGLRFDNCNTFLFAVKFEKCILNFSSFFRANLKETVFENCTLQDVEFVEANLTKAIFAESDLAGAIFENTNLEKADLRTASNFFIHPANNRIKKAIFSSQNLEGLLRQYDIIID